MSTPRIRLQFAKRLREERRKGQTHTGKSCGIDRCKYPLLSNVRIEKPPAIKIDTIEKLAKAFKITSSKLLDF